MGERHELGIAVVHPAVPDRLLPARSFAPAVRRWKMLTSWTFVSQEGFENRLALRMIRDGGARFGGHKNGVDFRQHLRVIKCHDPPVIPKAIWSKDPPILNFLFIFLTSPRVEGYGLVDRLIGQIICIKGQALSLDVDAMPEHTACSICVVNRDHM